MVDSFTSLAIFSYMMDQGIDVIVTEQPMDEAVAQEDESGRKIKGRGHKDASSLEVRISYQYGSIY